MVAVSVNSHKASNKLYERHLHAENRSHLYQPFDANNSPTGGYDSLDRLRQYQRGTLSSTGGPGNDGGGSITTPITLSNTNESAQYDLDGLGNWRRSVADPVGGSASTQVRQHNGLNEITRVGSTNFTYDGAAGASNGNLKDDGTLIYTWDALNRLKQVKRKSDNATIQDCVYDALNRRVRNVVSNGGLSGTIPNGTTDCLYQGWRCIEERDGSNNPTKQYVWGIYLDELIQQKNITALNNFGTNEVLYPLQDLLYRTIALSDSAGVIREAYDYDAYGTTLIFRNAGSLPAAITWTNSDTQVANPTCPFLFTGQRFDAETGNYYYKMRFYSPKWGRFLAIDNLYPAYQHFAYAYVENRPARLLDPLGLAWYDWCSCDVGKAFFTGMWNYDEYYAPMMSDESTTAGQFFAGDIYGNEIWPTPGFDLSVSGTTGRLDRPFRGSFYPGGGALRTELTGSAGIQAVYIPDECKFVFFRYRGIGPGVSSKGRPGISLSGGLFGVYDVHSGEDYAGAFEQVSVSGGSGRHNLTFNNFWSPERNDRGYQAYGQGVNWTFFSTGKGFDAAINYNMQSFEIVGEMKLLNPEDCKAYVRRCPKNKNGDRIFSPFQFLD